MARTVPGSGAVIEPIFDEIFGVRAVKVVNGGASYSSDDPPRLTIQGCGTPDVEALLYPIIDDDSGQIIHVRVLNRGRGYDPLRLQIVPQDETPNVITSFDVNKIWQTHPNSATTGTFSGTTDRLAIVADNHPKPTPIAEERVPGGSPGTTLAAYTPTQATYNPTTGSMVLTIGSHSYSPGDYIKLLPNSITFTCAQDNHATDHTYPRTTDPVHNVNILVNNTTVDSITIQVLGVAPSTNTTAHTFKSALAGAVYSGGGIKDRTFNQTFIYRGGKDVPDPGAREEQLNKVTGILANGGLIHTPEWGTTGGTPTNFSIDTVKYDYLKNTNAYDAIVDSNIQYYQSSKTITEFAQRNGVFDWGKIRQFTWNIKTEFDNIMLVVNQVDETLGQVEVGRNVGEIGGNGQGIIAKVVRDNTNQVTRVYLRQTEGSFSEGDKFLGSTGFSFRVNAVPTLLTNGVFYIDFGTDAAEFGSFVPGQYYFAPEDIKVQANYLIKWNQADTSNQPSNLHPHGHPMQFSTTADGLLNSGTLYYNSTGASAAPSTDYENEFAPLFIMNSDETNKIYYYCKYHRHMSGYSGDEGYMIFDSTPDNTPPVNDYYITDFFATGPDYSRHVDGHSKILGMSYDGYPIYGPWGYNASGAVAREVSGYRLRTAGELPGARPEVTTVSTVTYVVTVASGKFLFDGSTPNFLDLKRGKTYIFQQNDSSNDNQHLLLSATEDGWHSTGNTSDIGNTNYIANVEGVKYYINGSEVSYASYISGFQLATTREMRWTVPVNAPAALYTFAYSNSGHGLRTVQGGYVLGDLTQDYIWDSGVGSLDEHNGKFAVTPEYPNGTYAYFMTEDGSGNPVYPYVIGLKFYGVPLFEGSTVPPMPASFPSGAEGEVVLSTDNPGQLSYIKMTKKGDNYFGNATAKILGGGGTGATGNPVVQTVTGLSLTNTGRDYATPPTLIFEGGGGQGAQGAATIDKLGKVTSISVVNSGEYYQEPPYVLITGGGGLGAKAEAVINQGALTGINVIEPGTGYTSSPNVIFTKLVNLKRKSRARQAFNSSAIYLTGLVKALGASDSDVFVDSTDAYPGSGQIIVDTETISYTSKSAGKFSGLTRGVNFNYDQRIILDAGQNDSEGNSTYKFNVGDRVIRRVENSSNKVAKVYDWDPATRALLVTFEIDELAFIDGGLPSTEDAIVQFDAGVADSAPSGFDPHVVVDSTGSVITTLTVPITTLQDKAFQDLIPAGPPVGDGIPDLVNTGTDFLNQISLDGGIYNSLYGIEETLGGTNTTLFQVGDNIKDAAIPFKYATITGAGGLSDGVDHTALVKIYVELATDNNGQNFGVDELVTGAVSGVRGTCVSWDPSNGILTLKDITPYNTGNINVGIAGYLYEFSHDSTIIDFVIQDSGQNYSSTPLLEIQGPTSPATESRNSETIPWGGAMGDIQATATVNMTTAADQVASITITNGGYGYQQTIDNSYRTHPYILFTDSSNNISDGKFASTPNGAIAQAILGGEKINGNAGASYRIKRIEYQTTVRS